MERRLSDRKRTQEVADLYFQDRFVGSCNVSCVSPTGVFVEDALTQKFERGALVDLYFPIDPVEVNENKLLCMKGIVARVGEHGAGIRVYSKRLPLVPPSA